MSIFLTNFDEWYNNYTTVSPQQQYDLLMAGLSDPVPFDYADQIDLGGMILDIYELFIHHNLIDQALALVQTMQQHQPELYNYEFHYFDTFLVEYYLFRNEVDQVKTHLARFKANPVEGIDQLIPLLDQLSFYGASEVLVDLCRTAYNPVATSLNENAASELGVTSIMALLDQAYQQLKRGQAVNWNALGAEAAEFDFENNPQMLQEVAEHLTETIQGGTKLSQVFKQNRVLTLRKLMLGFCRYMSDQQQMSFTSSQAIWDAVFEFFENPERPKQTLATPDSYFAINQTALDQHLGHSIKSLFSHRRASGFAMLWGIPYIYEFLHTTGVVGELICQDAIAASSNLKKTLIQSGQHNLWHYSFVHRWQPPDCISTEVFALETEQFANSFDQSKPLGEDPREGLAFDFLSEPFQPFNAETEDLPSSLPESLDAADGAKPPQPDRKPPKPRRSPLQEAAKLPKTKNKSKKAKKSKRSTKGFGSH